MSPNAMPSWQASVDGVRPVVNRDLLELIIRSCTNVNVCNVNCTMFDLTPLLAACRRFDVTAVKLLLEQGAQVHLTQDTGFDADGRYGEDRGVWYTLVEYYSEREHDVDAETWCELFHLLVNHGANVHTKHKGGASLLEMVWAGHSLSKEPTVLLGQQRQS